MFPGTQQSCVGGDTSKYNPNADSFPQVGGDVIGISINTENMIKYKNCRLELTRLIKRKKRDEAKIRVHHLKKNCDLSPAFFSTIIFSR